MTTSNLDLVESALIHVRDVFQSIDETYHYHNYAHTKSVYDNAAVLLKNTDLNASEKEEVLIATLFHDIAIVKDYKNHEAESQKMARSYLNGKMEKERIDRVCQLINITNHDEKPQTLQEKIMKDADLFNLGDKSYFKVLKNIRKEWKIHAPNNPVKQKAFLNYALKFIKGHNYHTQFAVDHWNKNKLENIAKLEAMIKGDKKNKSDKLKVVEGLLKNNKVGQMILKTALRNHIDLSSLADSKASTMLSVNTLILTLALPLMLPRIAENPMLGIPTGILLLTSILSIVFATLVTRPAKMTGLSSAEDLKSGKGDLFFFGNFFKMNFDQYLAGMKSTLSNENNLDESIIRDLYFSGLTLGSKFNKLRICYAIFIIGVVLSGIGFLFILSTQLGF